MELILMSILVLLSLLVGICLGIILKNKDKEDSYSQESYDLGYEDGFIVATIETAAKDFPTSVDGKFYSTEAALRSMSEKESDN